MQIFGHVYDRTANKRLPKFSCLDALWLILTRSVPSDLVVYFLLVMNLVLLFVKQSLLRLIQRTLSGEIQKLRSKVAELQEKSCI